MPSGSVSARLHLRAGEIDEVGAASGDEARPARHAASPNGCRVPACRRARRCAARSPATGVGAEQCDRGLHRGRIGVVALVDERGSRRSRIASSVRLPRPFRRDEIGKRRRDLIHVGAYQLGRAEHGKRVLDHVAAGRADPRVELVAADLGGDGRVIGGELAIHQPRNRRAGSRRSRRYASTPASRASLRAASSAGRRD